MCTIKTRPGLHTHAQTPRKEGHDSCTNEQSVPTPYRRQRTLHLVLVHSQRREEEFKIDRTETENNQFRENIQRKFYDWSIPSLEHLTECWTWSVMKFWSVEEADFVFKLVITVDMWATFVRRSFCFVLTMGDHSAQISDSRDRVIESCPRMEVS